jgi:hypothetical protein
LNLKRVKRQKATLWGGKTSLEPPKKETRRKGKKRPLKRPKRRKEEIYEIFIKKVLTGGRR